MKVAYRVAIICGALPLIAGTAIFLAWVISPEWWHQLVGFILILAGCVFVAVGFISLLLYARMTRNISPRPRSLRPPAILLIANFPVCAAYVSVALTVESADFLTVNNQMSTPIQSLTLTDASSRPRTIPSIATGAHTYCVHFREGEVKYSLTVGAVKQSGVLAGYVSSMESHFEIGVAEGPRVSIQISDRPGSLAEYIRYCLFQ